MKDKDLLKENRLRNSTVEPTSLRYSTVALYLWMNFDSVIGCSNKSESLEQ